MFAERSITKQHDLSKFLMFFGMTSGFANLRSNVSNKHFILVINEMLDLSTAIIPTSSSNCGYKVLF